MIHGQNEKGMTNAIPFTIFLKIYLANLLVMF